MTTSAYQPIGETHRPVLTCDNPVLVHFRSCASPGSASGDRFCLMRLRERGPRTAWPAWRLVEPVERLDHGVVATVAPGADRGDDAVVGEAAGVADRQVLDAAVAVVDESGEVGAGFGR